jgi:hypothetical protein
MVVGGTARRKETYRTSISRWEDDIQTNISKMGWSDMDWIDLAQDRDQWQVLVIT